MSYDMWFWDEIINLYDPFITDLNKKLDTAKPVSEHFYSVLSKSEIGKKSSLGQHLVYKFTQHNLADH